MGKVTNWKNKVLEGVTMSGMTKAVITTVAIPLHLGQTFCLSAIVNGSGIKAVDKVIALAKTEPDKEKALAEIAKTVKGSGFDSAESMVNLFYQFKEEQRSVIGEIAKDPEGLKALQASLKALASAYVYTN